MTDLAKLVVKLEAQTTQYMSQLDSANKKLSKFSKDTGDQLGAIKKKFDGFGSAINKGLAFIGVGIGFNAIIKATSEAEKSLALLDNAVKQSGGSAGYTTNELSDMAGELQKLTTFSDDAVMGVEQLLLRFRSIKGDNFERATKDALDLSTALGIDASAAAKLLGKALESPEKGVKALAKAGVVLSESQIATIKKLSETGEKAKAQGMLLSQLESRYGGAAKAARETFGGALEGLKNAFDDLLENKGGVKGSISALNQLTELLQDDKTKAGFDGITTSIIGIGKAALNAASGIVTLADNLTAVIKNDRIGKLKEQIDFLQRMSGKSFVAAGYGDIGTGYFSAAEGAEKLIELQRKLNDELENAATIANKGGSPNGRKYRPPGPGIGDEDEDTGKTKYTLDEVNIHDILQKYQTQTSAMQDYYAKLDEASKTSDEKQISQFNALEASLIELRNTGRITAEEFNLRYSEALDDVLSEFEVTAKKINLVLEKTPNKFLEEATKNVQDILGDGIADALNNGFEGGAKGALRAFRNMLNQMVAQSLAADLGKKLFGADGVGGGGGGGGGGWLSGIMGYASKLFGGSRDSGGRGSPGKAYLIGTGAQPEMFVPDTAGSFIPAGSGGMTVNNYFTIAAPNGSISRQTEQQIGAAAARGLSQANRRNN